MIAIRENEARAEAIGLPVYRYKLLCFVIAGAVGRARRRAARQPRQVREPERAALDPVRAR